jgi:hypothetical protein
MRTPVPPVPQIIINTALLYDIKMQGLTLQFTPETATKTPGSASQAPISPFRRRTTTRYIFPESPQLALSGRVGLLGSSLHFIPDSATSSKTMLSGALFSGSFSFGPVDPQITPACDSTLSIGNQASQSPPDGPDRTFSHKAASCHMAQARQPCHQAKPISLTEVHVHPLIGPQACGSPRDVRNQSQKHFSLTSHPSSHFGPVLPAFRPHSNHLHAHSILHAQLGKI